MYGKSCTNSTVKFVFLDRFDMMVYDTSHSSCQLLKMALRLETGLTIKKFLLWN